MKRTLAFITFLIFFGATFLWGQTPKGKDYERGKGLFNDKCSICHGTNGDGKGPAGAALNPKPTDFTNPTFWNQTDIEKKITDAIKQGKGMMPRFDMKADEIKAVVEYMSQTFKRQR